MGSVMPRTRTRTHYRVGHSYRKDLGSSVYVTVPNSVSAIDSCTDEVHSPPFVVDGPLLVKRTIGQPGRADYDINIKVGADWKRFRNRRIPMAMSHGSLGSWSYPVAHWKNEAIRAIQGTQPLVNLPVSIAELRDLPHILHNAFERGIARGVADTWLTNSFGIAPMVSDLFSLMNLQRGIANRIARMKKAHKTGKIRGSLSSGATFIGTFPLERSRSCPDKVVKYKSYCTTSSKAWYSASINPLFDLKDTLAMAVEDPLGLYTPFSVDTLWEATPWSWLFDYFADVGDILAVWGNNSPFNITRLNLMCTAKIINTQHPYGFTSNGGITAKSFARGKLTFVEKNRWNYLSPTLEIALAPILSATQAANVAALVVSGRSYN